MLRNKLKTCANLWRHIISDPFLHPSPFFFCTSNSDPGGLHSCLLPSAENRLLVEGRVGLTSSMKCNCCKKIHLWFKGTAKWLIRKVRCSTLARARSEIRKSSVPYLLPVADLTFVCIASLDWQITQYFPLTFMLPGLIIRFQISAELEIMLESKLSQPSTKL